VLDIKGTPWNRRGGEAVMDHEVTTGRGPIVVKDPTTRAAPTIPRAPIGQIGKRVYITENSVDEFGATLGCRGCLANGVTSTEACRARVTERLLNAPEHAEKAKVADEKLRAPPGKPGACDIADAGDDDAANDLPANCQARGARRANRTCGGCRIHICTPC
jgi:hypothetical protein